MLSNLMTLLMALGIPLIATSAQAGLDYDVLRCKVGPTSLQQLREGECALIGNFKSVNSELSHFYKKAPKDVADFESQLAFYYSEFQRKGFSLKEILSNKIPTGNQLRLQAVAISRLPGGKIAVEGCLPLSNPSAGMIGCLSNGFRVTDGSQASVAVVTALVRADSAWWQSVEGPVRRTTRGACFYQDKYQEEACFWEPSLKSISFHVAAQERDRAGQAICQSLGYKWLDVDNALTVKAPKLLNEQRLIVYPNIHLKQFSTARVTLDDKWQLEATGKATGKDIFPTLKSVEFESGENMLRIEPGDAVNLPIEQVICEE